MVSGRQHDLDRDRPEPIEVWLVELGLAIAQGVDMFVLDPAIGADENKFITSRIILDATIPFDWKVKPTEIKLTESVMAKVKARWKEYGID